jgi:hypothetical protein
MSAQVNEEAVLSWEINQFTGVNEHHVIERAEIISQRDYTVWVRTPSDSLTFHRYKSVMYSDVVEKPLVAYGKRKIILILPKR